MKRNHMTMCLVGIAAAFALVAIVGVKSSTVTFLLFALACPLMMYFMMKMMMSPDERSSDGGTAHSTSPPPRLERPADRHS